MTDHRRRLLFVSCLIAVVGAGLTRPAGAQLILGQYEDEAPFRTWNSFPFIPAAALGRGETSYAWTNDAAAFPANPALLFSLPRITATIGGSFHEASFLKYGPVNTGILDTDSPISLAAPALDLATVTFRTGRWAFGLNASVAETYDRPLAEYVYKSRDIVQYRVRFEQTGILRDFALSAGYRIGQGLSLGIGLHFVSGRLERHFLEEWASPKITITDDKTQRYRGFFINGGVFWEVAAKFRFAAVFRTPYKKTGEGESLVRYQAPAGLTDIAIDGRAEDTLRQPFILGLGLNFELFPRLWAGADFSYIRWSSYEITWFGDRQAREFSGVLKTGGGLEYLTGFKLFGAPAEIAVRAGISNDPQPMKNPLSSYFGYTVGTGLRRGGLVLDLGFLLARESGSGDGLQAHRAALSLGYGF